MTSAPTGCATALSGGYTNCRCCSIPTGHNFKSTPKHIETTNTNSLRTMSISICNVVSRFMDEHRMTGRPYWGQRKHRHEELRRPKNSRVHPKTSPFSTRHLI